MRSGNDTKNLTTMRLIISTFILCLLSLKMFGQQKQPQTEQLHPKFSEAYCPSAQVLVKSVIFYENYAKVYLAFEEVIVGQQVLITSLDKEYQQTFLLYSNELLVDNIPNGKLYEIEVKDACGDYVSIAFFTTRVEDIETHGIEVSNRMFKAITVFQKQKNNLPLTDFLRDLKTVSPYEKIAFIQQYFLDSRPFTKDEGTKLPEVTLLEKGGEECLCKFVFNTTQRATPAIVTADGKLKHVHEESVNSNGGIKIPWDSDSRYWWYRNTMGPSKWHYLWSEGWEAGGTDREVSYNVLSGLDEESQPSPHMVELA